MPDFSRFLLVTDLDGTFLGSHATLVEKNLEAVAYFKAHGGHVMAATGRVVPNLLLVVPSAAEIFNAPCVSSNGAYIYDFTTKQVLQTTPMDAVALKELIFLVEQLDPEISVRISTDTGFLVNANRLNDMMKEEIASMHFVGEIIPAEDFVTEGAAWYKAVLRAPHDALCRIREVLYPKYKHLFEFCFSSPTLFELQAKGCTKATGVSFVSDLLARQIGKPLTVVAVGDQENDLPMLAAADIAACPENALDTVKDIAHIKLCHHTEGAVADLIAKLEQMST